jgi:DNA-binding transcriptional LysR family regulator
VDEVSDLRLFTAIVSGGSLSETARRTGASLPALSRRLARLETRLGVRLIDRGSRHFTLTQEGRLLHQRATQILADIDETEAEIGNRVLSPRGHLRIGAPSEIGRSRIAAIAADFTETHPGLSIELVLTDERLDGTGEAFDIGLHVDRPSSVTVVIRKLLGSRRVLCASPAYLDHHGTPSSAADLDGHRCIRLVRSAYDHDRWLFRDGGTVREYPAEGPLSTNCSDVLHHWALAGRGIALKELWDIEADLSAGRLVALLPNQFCMELELYVTYPATRRLPARTRMFIDHIAATLARTRPPNERQLSRHAPRIGDD